MTRLDKLTFFGKCLLLCILTCDKQSNLSIAHLNVQKISAKQVDVIYDKLLHNCDIMCFN